LDSLHTKVQEFLLLFPVASRMIIGHLFQIASRFFDFFSQAVSPVILPATPTLPF
jgi:hypothetical protein